MFKTNNMETPTGYWIDRKEFTTSTYINLKSKLSTIDFKENEVPVAFFEYKLDDVDYVVIPKIRRDLLEFIMQKRLLFNKIDNDNDSVVTYNKPKDEPLPHQKPILDKILSVWNNDMIEDKRAVISIPPGGGKSFMSAYLVYQKKKKFIFVVYSAKLITQTYETFCRYLGKDGLLVMEKSNTFDDIDWNKVKGLFISHSMLRTLYKTFSFEYVISVLSDKMGAEIVIYDEFDRETGNLYRIQAFGPFRYNLYLTGTPFRSLKDDDKVFQLIFKPVLSLGNDVPLEKKKDIHVVHWRFNPTPKEHTKMNLYDSKLFKSYYNDFLANKDVFIDFVMSQFYIKDDSLIRRIIKDKGQIVIYAGRIENCQLVKEKLIKNFDIDEDDIGVYNSDISNKEKVEAEKKTWIVTTMSSLGRGYDNKNVRVLIYLEFSFSQSEFLQTCSRVGRTGGDFGYVIYGVDHSFWKVEANWNKKINDGIIQRQFKHVFNYDIPDSWKEHYIYSYRKSSPTGIELIKENQKKKDSMKWSKRI